VSLDPGPSLLLLLSQGTGAPEGPADLNFLFLIGFMVIFFWLFIIGPQRREAQEKQKLLAGLKKNDRVLTAGGFYGTIMNIKDDEVTLRVDDQNKVKLRVVKSSVAKVLGTEAEGAPDESSAGKKS
jgi:preprotein translocase subunit YajC